MGSSGNTVYRLERKSFCSQTVSRWDAVQQDVIVIVRTSLTPSQGFVVVYPILRSESSIWAAKRLELMNSPCVSILCPTNLSNFLLKPLRPLVFVATSTW